MARPTKDLPNLSFETAEVPATTTVVVNPFAEPVAALAAKWDDANDRSAGALTVKVPADDVKRLRSRITDAASAVGRSSRVAVTEPDKAGNVSLTFWLKPAFKRGEKSDDK